MTDYIEHNGHRYLEDTAVESSYKYSGVLPESVWEHIDTAIMRSGMSYEYDEVRIYRHRGTKQIAAAHDVGCSCPTPFGDTTVGGLQFIDSLQQYDDFVAEHHESPMGGAVVDSIVRVRKRVEDLLPESPGRSRPCGCS